ncbi:MAG TPA: DUF5615 family PIN-like protein [Patescibacteria group bacterium]|nr:DUF5615 family PIN-like protein [Patescibacteria group bacterium]
MPSKKSHIQLYADECFPIDSVLYLKTQGYSVIHAFDKKLTKVSDRSHLKVARKLNRVLITLDRDFMYYEQATLQDSPGVIIISTGSAVPKSINQVCKKFLKSISVDYIKESTIKVTRDKIIKKKDGKVTEKMY